MPQDDTTRRENRWEDVGAKTQEELRRIVQFLNDEVVPEVRRSGSTALRSAADKLQKLAQHMDEANDSRAGKP
jgi:hypothetical protein